MVGQTGDTTIDHLAPVDLTAPKVAAGKNFIQSSTQLGPEGPEIDRSIVCSACSPERSKEARID